MKNGIWVIVTILSVASVSACAWTPKDEAWRASLETDAPEGTDGNCLLVAQVLQQKYGGSIVVISHPKHGDDTHAVLMLENGWMLDNGTIGYQARWSDLHKEGWKWEYWWDD